MDMTEAKFVDTSPQIQLHKVPLAILDVSDEETIFNVIIKEEEKDNMNGK